MLRIKSVSMIYLTPGFLAPHLFQAGEVYIAVYCAGTATV